jgi:hypothetical protein
MAALGHRAVVLTSLVASLTFAMSLSLSAQEQRGTVKADSLQVYSEMSTQSDAVSTLPHGASVRIAMSVTNDEGSWCSVSKLDTSEKLGYVRCDGLDRQNAPSTAATGGGAIPMSSAAFHHPTRDQKAWAIAASAILASFNRESLNSLPSGGNAQSARKLLRDWWSISNRDDLLGALSWIEQGGHRQLFSELGLRTAKASSEQIRQALTHLNPEQANSVRVAHRYYDQFGTQSIAGWDFARYINLCRWGVTAGYLSEDEAWPRVMYAASTLQQTFGSWRDFGENYLVGREFWSLRQTTIDGRAMRSVCQRLLSDRESPWSRIPWNTPLQ